jgi:hypothetical protein
MLCAHTVRRLKPGTFDRFAEAFRPQEDDPPAGWVRFHMLRGVADYRARRAAIEPYVDAVIANGVYETVVAWTAEGVPAS